MKWEVDSIHRRAISVFLAVYPTILLLTYFLGPFISDASLPIRILVITSTAVPIIVYILLSPLQKLVDRILGADQQS